MRTSPGANCIVRCPPRRGGGSPRAPGGGADGEATLAEPTAAPAFIEADPASEKDDWWPELLGLLPRGAVLVRPDAHIVGRYRSPAESLRLAAAMADLLQPAPAR